MVSSRSTIASWFSAHRDISICVCVCVCVCVCECVEISTLCAHWSHLGLERRCKYVQNMSPSFREHLLQTPSSGILASMSPSSVPTHSTHAHSTRAAAPAEQEDATPLLSPAEPAQATLPRPILSPKP